MKDNELSIEEKYYLEKELEKTRTPRIENQIRTETQEKRYPNPAEIIKKEKVKPQQKVESTYKFDDKYVEEILKKRYEHEDLVKKGLKIETKKTQ